MTVHLLGGHGGTCSVRVQRPRPLHGQQLDGQSFQRQARRRASSDRSGDSHELREGERERKKIPSPEKTNKHPEREVRG